MTGTGEASSGRSAAGMHAFLFADLRGYTQFAATRGDRAAAQLLDRYRSLVREQVARHAGAEVRTEGDSFYVVFASVSGAVQCALAIATAARDASLADPALPMNVGIGVHFGETVDTAEGSVGSAVNLAARLASAAGPNEVLVSDVVRSLLGSTPHVRTVSAGSRRLKGFAEPVQVFRAVVAEGPAVASTRRRPVRTWASLTVGGAAVTLIVVGLALASNRPGAAPTSSPSQVAGSATPAASPRAFKWLLLEPGQYIERRFVPNVSLTVDEGWCGGFFSVTTVPGADTFYLYSPGTVSGGLGAQEGDPCAAAQRADDAGFVDLHRVEQVYGPTACENGLTSSIGRSWDALVDYLTTIPGTSVTNRVSASLGGALGAAFDLHVDQATTCPHSGAPVRAVLAFPMTVLNRSTQQPRVEPRWWGEGQYLHVWVLDVDGQLVVASLGHEGSDEAISRAFSDKAYRLIQSLRFVSTS